MRLMLGWNRGIISPANGPVSRPTHARHKPAGEGKIKAKEIAESSAPDGQESSYNQPAILHNERLNF